MGLNTGDVSAATSVYHGPAEQAPPWSDLPSVLDYARSTSWAGTRAIVMVWSGSRQEAGDAAEGLHHKSDCTYGTVHRWPRVDMPTSSPPNTISLSKNLARRKSHPWQDTAGTNSLLHIEFGSRWQRGCRM